MQTEYLMLPVQGKIYVGYVNEDGDIDTWFDTHIPQDLCDDAINSRVGPKRVKKMVAYWHEQFREDDE